LFSIIGKCFTWKGRLGRMDFCAGILGLTILVTAWLASIWADMYFNKVPKLMTMPGFIFLFFVLWFVCLFLELSLIARRFHDLGKSGYHLFLLLVPFVNFYYMALLFFKKGEDEPKTRKARRA
jgi:uncharacterized membrane protein YhaH (DUF805 family)